MSTVKKINKQDYLLLYRNQASQTLGEKGEKVNTFSLFVGDYIVTWRICLQEVTASDIRDGICDDQSQKLVQKCKAVVTPPSDPESSSGAAATAAERNELRNKQVLKMKEEEENLYLIVWSFT